MIVGMDRRDRIFLSAGRERNSFDSVNTLDTVDAKMERRLSLFYNGKVRAVRMDQWNTRADMEADRFPLIAKPDDLRTRQHGLRVDLSLLAKGLDGRD